MVPDSGQRALDALSLQGGTAPISVGTTAAAETSSTMEIVANEQIEDEP